ncbi:Rieske (2Fe-2S) protein [Candidatus Fermentibacteria bacterium]|nr:Rieske (2Fe-2S) protein [Candidatus Fermentibacteria bacterium]
MTTRRRVLRDLATGLAGLAVWPAKTEAQDPKTEEPSDSTRSAPPDTAASHAVVSIPLANAKDLLTIGGSAVVTAAGHTLLLVRDSDASVVAFESRCTHKQVTLKYDHKNSRLNCPAHGSRFDLAGKVQKGPAKEDLRAYGAILEDDAVVVMLPK